MIKKIIREKKEKESHDFQQYYDIIINRRRNIGCDHHGETSESLSLILEIF